MKEINLETELTMHQQDWSTLLQIVAVSNELRHEIMRTIADGKKQISVENPKVLAWALFEIPPMFWIRLGALIRQWGTNTNQFQDAVYPIELNQLEPKVDK